MRAGVVREEAQRAGVRNRFFFNDAATTEIYTLSLHDALPIFVGIAEILRGLLRPLIGFGEQHAVRIARVEGGADLLDDLVDRKSTRLNSSHANISYAVFCLKKKQHSCWRTASPIHRCIPFCVS